MLLHCRQKYDVEFLLQQEWYDSRLQFPNQTSFDVLNGIHHQGDIWLPDTNFHMHGDFKPSQRPIRFTLKVHRDSRVEYTTRYVGQARMSNYHPNLYVRNKQIFRFGMVSWFALVLWQYNNFHRTFVFSMNIFLRDCC